MYIYIYINTKHWQLSHEPHPGCKQFHFTQHAHVGVVPRFTSRRRWERGPVRLGQFWVHGMEWGPLLIVLRWVRLQSAESQVYIYILLYIYIAVYIYTSHIPSIHGSSTESGQVSNWSNRAKIGSGSGLLWQWAQHRHEPRGWHLCLGSSTWPGANKKCCWLPSRRIWKMGDWSNKDVDHRGVPKICGIPQTQDGFQFSTQTSLVDWWRSPCLLICLICQQVSRTLASEWQCRSRKIEQHTSNSGNWLNSNCCVNFDFDPCHVSQVFVWDH